MKQIFDHDATDAVLLIDASNAFNRMNRMAALHNIRIICPKIATFIINTYRMPARLFIAGGGEITSREGTTQGDPLAMPWYSVNTVIIINQLRIQHPDISQVWLADDAAAAGKLKPLFEWYNELDAEGKKYGYYVNKSKSWLIVKNPEMENIAKSIFGNNVQITSEGKRRLGAVIGSKEYEREYCEGLVTNWSKELKNLCEFAISQPQAAYTAYTKGYKSKFTYFMRTIKTWTSILHR